MTDPDVEMVKVTLARYSLALGADWGDTELWRDKEKALGALSRISSRLAELEVERDRWRNKWHAEIEAAADELARLHRIEEAAWIAEPWLEAEADKWEHRTNARRAWLNLRQALEGGDTTARLDAARLFAELALNLRQSLEGSEE